MKALILPLLFCCLSATAQQKLQRPVDCYTVQSFTAVMKEMKMEPTQKFDTEYGVLGIAANGTHFIVYEYMKKENVICILAEAERV